ncbi:polysaccharide deacetylase family protein [Trinickia caryophylli]|uniref:Polysaccharide deacetylase n=2 Tax=Trinickia caryophylli TaxID=28094 RepID=A0A1X7D0T4_TRICW|nr:polysaccharide deacetylase family protein [Trinickia caryophylli]PMS13558.1 polysaccharide deacetylase family protein [Trinickia caryophylli]TRX15275.1 polysaccharide deacetylase family protein [Trinickia caryophylli]WQE15151.1 polysaccharide deacetylase family protein [Trinickia caryophylli]SMF06593.1 Polysaccharide deacetylase [Trinickia caryophylli]GLU31110.1 hypothetical protein Busp01_09520 [Trinickia caryophylli]
MLAVVAAGLLLGLGVGPAAHAARSEQRVAVLAYHRFADTPNDSMTVRVTTFEAQLAFLRAHGYHFVALRDVVDWLENRRATLPDKPVALTVDDGHRSVQDVLRPIALREHLPVTLFIYPSAISNASYALTWEELARLRDTGMFDVQSHTYWHPNFNVERRQRTPDDFRRFAEKQLQGSRASIEQKLGGSVDLLAWPFGIVDEELEGLAAQAGYRAAFALGARLADKQSHRYAVTRFLITDGVTPAVLGRLLGEPAAERRPEPEKQP